MTGRRLLPILLLLTLGLACAAPAAAQLCAEPSALDLDSGVEPLRVAKGAGSLSFTWEDVAAPAYEVVQGTIDSLFTAGRYDHASAARVALPTAVLPTPAVNSYFIARTECDDPVGPDSLGRDSFGRERPDGPLALVTIAVVGGQGVFGLQVTLQHPPATTLASIPDCAGVGPYAPGAPGSPAGVFNADTPATVRAAALFLQVAPSPAFDPPPASPGQDVMEIAFRFTGAAPAPSDFAVVVCAAGNDWGAFILGATCEVARVEVR